MMNAAQKNNPRETVRLYRIPDTLPSGFIIPAVNPALPAIFRPCKSGPVPDSLYPERKENICGDSIFELEKGSLPF